MKLHAPAIALIVSASLALGGCAPVGRLLNGEPKTAGGAGEKVEVTQARDAKFEPKKIDPIVASDPAAPVKDEGLGVQWRIMTVQQGSSGGAEFVIEMKNLNEDFAVPPSAIGDPELSLKSGGKIDRMKVDDQGLDIPLGALSTTVITYSFNTSPWNLSNAEFTIGNAVFKGNLNL